MVDVPDLDQVPDLPDAWVAGLTGGRAATRRLTRSDVDVDAWLTNLPDGDPCEDVIEALDRARLALAAGGSRYEGDAGRHDGPGLPGSRRVPRGGSGAALAWPPPGRTLPF